MTELDEKPQTPEERHLFTRPHKSDLVTPTLNHLNLATQDLDKVLKLAFAHEEEYAKLREAIETKSDEIKKMTKEKEKLRKDHDAEVEENALLQETITRPRETVAQKNKEVEHQKVHCEIAFEMWDKASKTVDQLKLDMTAKGETIAPLQVKGRKFEQGKKSYSMMKEALGDS
ncbi:hypothetical protein BU23DRAFT_564352 [Bimuria novae-zelandiae CBS 107.79]|uniref:Kinetochore protein Spc24 n=1 Tax=Bimuria novae-zelandiae CBS 107.79 TaxID=1447943 RepID=A0A6A5VLA8_9PLEO|nr:hypothetical protein BU23DRAFT_564352 [Bimuria novae-zelandiae CBS 107.79]